MRIHACMTASLAVPGVIGALMLQSAFSGFCPVYFALGKLRGTKGVRAD